MIRIFEAKETNFETNGLAVLAPSECTVEEVLNGKFDLKLVHPIDEDGKWKYIDNDRIVVAPCPTAATPPIDFITVQYMRASWGATTRICFLNFDENGSASIDHYGGTIAANETFMFCCAGPNRVVRLNNVTYYKAILSFTPSEVTYCYMEWPQNATCDYISDHVEDIYIYNGQTLNAEYGAQSQITNQRYRIYRVVVEMDKITAYAQHIFYDIEKCVPIISFCVGENDIAKEKIFSTIFAIGRGVLGRKYAFHTNVISTPKAGLFGWKSDYEYKSWEKNLAQVFLGSNGLCDIYSAEIHRNNNAIGFYSRIGQDTDIVIREKKNMCGLQIDKNIKNIITRVIPLGKDADGNIAVISHFSDRGDDVISKHASEYSSYKFLTIYVSEADQTKTKPPTNAQCVSMMVAAAEAVFNVEHRDEPEISVDVDFVMLDTMEEYKDIAGLEKVFLGDSVRVISSRLNVDTYVRVNAYTFDCLAKRYKTIKMESDRRRKGLLGVIQEYTSGTIIKNYSGWTLLWSGSWGANGSSPLTIPGLSNCNELMFGLSSRANVVRRKLLSASLSMNVTDDGLSTNSGLYHYAHTLTTEGNTISVDVSKRWLISNSGAVSYALNTTNRIAFIWGRYNAEDA